METSVFGERRKNCSISSAYHATWIQLEMCLKKLIFTRTWENSFFACKIIILVISTLSFQFPPRSQTCRCHFQYSSASMCDLYLHLLCLCVTLLVRLTLNTRSFYLSSKNAKQIYKMRNEYHGTQFWQSYFYCKYLLLSWMQIYRKQVISTGPMFASKKVTYRYCFIWCAMRIWARICVWLLWILLAHRKREDDIKCTIPFD